MLPIKKHKLIFTLCAKCFDEKFNSYNSERALLRTWTTDEVSKALRKRYFIMEIYAVWHFKGKSTNLFKDYVKDFMKIKLQTSPWENVIETIHEYITAIKTCLDINLNPENIAPIPCCKNMPNSLWVKFGQRQNMTQRDYVLILN